MQNLISQLQTLDVRVALILDDRVESRRRFKEKAYRAYPPPPSKISEDYRVLGYICICEQKDKYLRQFLSQLFTCLSLAILFLSYADSAR